MEEILFRLQNIPDFVIAHGRPPNARRLHFPGAHLVCLEMNSKNFVIPANAGIQVADLKWIPAFAGMTGARSRGAPRRNSGYLKFP